MRRRRLIDASGRPLNFTVRRFTNAFGHVISSLGVAIRLNWAWLFCVRKTTEDGRATGLRRCPNDLPVFRFQHYSARHTGSGAYCYSIFFQNVRARLTIVGGVRERRVLNAPALKLCAVGA